MFINTGTAAEASISFEGSIEYAVLKVDKKDKHCKDECDDTKCKFSSAKDGYYIIFDVDDKDTVRTSYTVWVESYDINWSSVLAILFVVGGIGLILLACGIFYFLKFVKKVGKVVKEISEVSSSSSTQMEAVEPPPSQPSVVVVATTVPATGAPATAAGMGPEQSGYAQPAGYPPQGGYPPQQGGYPPQGYPPQQPVYGDPNGSAGQTSGVMPSAPMTYGSNMNLAGAAGATGPSGQYESGAVATNPTV